MASRRNQSNRKRKSLQNPRSQRLNPRTLKGPQLMRLPQSRVRNSAEDTNIEYALGRTQEYNLNHVVKGKLPVVALKPGFHMVVSVVSVVRKKFIGQI